jgi:hypothetical protein
LQGFSEHKITCGASGYLRQEFRELELLDDITKLFYENKLPNNINGKLRNTVIRQYQIYKGTNYIHDRVPSQLKWTLSDPMDLLPVITDSSWQVINNKYKSENLLETPIMKKPSTKQNNTGAQHFVEAKGTMPVLSSQGTKRKADGQPLSNSLPKSKKKKISFIVAQDSPAGIIWDAENYSCAYDSIFTILCDIWIQDPKKWTKWFCWFSKPLERLAYNYRKVLQGQNHLEGARNDVRRLLYKVDNNLFPYGKVGTSVSELAQKLIDGDQLACSAQLQCISCKTLEPIGPPDNLMEVLDKHSKSINGWFQNWQKQPTDNCQKCRSPQHILHKFAIAPEILMFSINVTNIGISKTVRVKHTNKDILLPLKGVVYSGEFHFVSRIISDKDVWFHDGMVTKSKCYKEGHITDFTDQTLMIHKKRHAVLAIYAKK